MYANLGQGQMIDLAPPHFNDDILYSHDAVSRERKKKLSMAEQANLYLYTMNNPVKNLDPSGLATVCGVYVWLYTGDYCNDQEIYDAAVAAAGGVINCWWDCEVTIHQCAATHVGNVAAAATTLTFTHLEVAKTARELAGGLPGQASVTTLQSRLSYYLLQRGYEAPANLLRRSAAQVSRLPISTGAGSALAGIAIVEAGISIYCGYKCS